MGDNEMTRQQQENEILEIARDSESYEKNMRTLFAHMTIDQIDALHRSAVQSLRKVNIALTVKELEYLSEGMSALIDNMTHRNAELGPTFRALKNRIDVTRGANED